LRPERQHSLFALLNAFSDPSTVREQLLEMCERIFGKTIYASQLLSTQTQTTSQMMTAADVYKMCFETERVLKRLMIFSSPEEIESAWYFVYETARLKGHPVFYACSPENLICGRYHIHRNPDNSGVLMKGPGGPFHSFLETNRTQCSPVLIVNYDHFTPEDFIRFDALLSRKRSVDGVFLPDDLIIIGLINQRRSDYYPDAGFFARFERVHYFNCKKQTGHMASTTHAITYALPSVGPVVTIDVFHQPDWKKIILGEWELAGNQLMFQEGLLLKALNASIQTIGILNAPCSLSLKQFLHQVRIEKKIDYANRTIPLGDQVAFFTGDHYQWPLLRSYFQ
ncbi:MAG TPA: hypothetical protein VJL60_05920, partial [Gammaproteobacteria bacterium]|nr:hypothetical protein [Gammaproteobacteria bacterium]